MTDKSESEKPVTLEDKPKRKRVSRKKPETPEVPAVSEKLSEEGDLSGRLHKPVPEQFLADLDLFADIFEKNPAILEPVREVFEYHLVDPIDRKTFPRIVNAMSMLLGPSATMVLMTACHVNSAAFFEDLLFSTAEGNEKVRAAVWVIQHLTSIYGNRVQQAYTLSSGTMDEDWHTVDVNTFKREGENEFWIVELNMMLYSGKDFKIRMTPDSIFQLTEILSGELSKNIPKEAVDQVLMNKCSGNFKEFYEKFYGSGEDEKKSEDDEDPAGYA